MNEIDAKKNFKPAILQKSGFFGNAYFFTRYSKMKMKHYGISENRIKRIVRFPARVEEGIASKTIAAMQPADGKQYQEIWTMYQIVKKRLTDNRRQIISNGEEKEKKSLDNFKQWTGDKDGVIKIITAWRYPGKSPARNPVPEEIMEEVRNIL